MFKRSVKCSKSLLHRLLYMPRTVPTTQYLLYQLLRLQNFLAMLFSDFNTQTKGDDVVCSFHSKTSLSINVESKIVIRYTAGRKLETIISIWIASNDQYLVNRDPLSIRDIPEKQFNLVLKQPTRIDIQPRAYGASIILFYHDENLHRGVEERNTFWNPNIPYMKCYVWSLGRFTIESKRSKVMELGERKEYIPRVNINTGIGLRCMIARAPLEDLVSFGQIEFNFSICIESNTNEVVNTS